MVRTNGAQLSESGIRVVMTRHTPSATQVDLFCAGDEDACARLRARGCQIIACHDGWYPDDQGGGIAVWGGGRHWEIRDTPLHVKEQGE